MKFPITRESLQAIDLEKEKQEKYDIAIQSHINSLVSVVCQYIERLILWEVPHFTNLPTNYIEKKIKEREDLMKNKRYIWKDLKSIRMNSQTQRINVDESILLPHLVAKLKETFIGCDIIIDPLKTYLIIDWS